MTVKGAWWATAAQPVILGLGAVLASLNLDIFDSQPISWNFSTLKLDKSSKGGLYDETEREERDYTKTMDRDWNKPMSDEEV